MTLRSILVAVLLTTAAAAAHAQDGTLDRVQNLIGTGRFTEAASTLERWEKEYADPRSDASTADRARALYLRGVLSTDLRDAEDAFLGVVLSYPSSAVAPEALLRLGQGLLTADEPRRAVAYLERLRSDYPGTSARETGMLWLARAQLAAGSPAAACRTAREGGDGASSANLRTLLDIERDRACGSPAARDDGPAGAGPSGARDSGTRPGDDAPRPIGRAVPQAPDTATPGTTRAAPPPAAPTPRPAATVAAGPEYGVQTAAFRDPRSAQTVAAQLRAAGFDVRVVRTRDSDLHRVRFGAFATRAEAVAAAQRVRDAGFATLIVNDVRDERR